MKFDTTTRKLTPQEGLYLSQMALTNENDRIFSELMYLGVNDTPDNYVEKTEHEKEAWEEAHKIEEPQVEDIEPDE